MIAPLLPTLIASCIVVVLPLGVAGQNIGLGVALALFIYLCVVDRGVALRSALSSKLIRRFGVLWALIIIPIVIATLRSGQTKEASRFLWGYAFGAVIPVMGVVLAKMDSRPRIQKLFSWVLAFTAVIAITQSFWGWKIDDGEIVDSIRRAQVFYSHPLTLAYVALVGMPFAFFAALGQMKNIWAWVLALSFAVIIAASQSVTVLALSAVVAPLSVILTSRGKPRALLLAAMVATAALTFATENAISEKIKVVLSGSRGDDETSYPDDRMAFWHAHWEMFKDAPLLGHGAGLEKEDRAPYYDKIGLGHIKRHYEAHNMYLQYAVEGGIIPCLALIALLIWLTLLSKRAGDLPFWQRAAFVTTAAAFACGGLTQNAVQDSEVRFALLGYIGVLFWAVTRAEGLATTHPILKLQ